MNRKIIQSFLYDEINRMIPLLLILISFSIVPNTVWAQNSESPMFQIVYNKKSVPILYDQRDADVVGISAKALAN
ncbi:MAG: hypothetical protein RQ763_04925, partial [Sulfurimonas sp.]|uniref:hypothetical protein n=1 Tax=Sulfurimonas sp. TaxID=2022749 RepID=UPI0028CBEC34